MLQGGKNVASHALPLMESGSSWFTSACVSTQACPRSSSRSSRSRKPRANLGINGGSHFEMTGRMSVAREQLIVGERPDPVIVPSDVTSTLAGALAAAKLHIPAAHLVPDHVLATGACQRRSTRVLTDHISALVAMPHRGGSRKSASRGYRRGAHDIGGVICDATPPLLLGARKRLTFGAERSFAAANVHRVESSEVFVFF